MTGRGRPARVKAFIVLASQALAAAVAYASLVAVGRFFLPPSYGSFAYALGWTTLLLLLSDVGLSYVHQRHVAMGNPVGPSLGVLIRLRLAFLAVLVAVGLAIGLAVPGLAERALGVTTLGVLAWVVLLQVAVIFRSFAEATWQAQQRVHLVEALRLVDAVVTVAVLTNAGLLVAAVQGWTPPFVAVGHRWADLLGITGPFTVEQGAMMIAGSYTVAKLVCLGLAMAWARKERWPIGPWDGQLARAFLRLAVPLSIVSLLGLLTSSLDVVVLGLTWDAEEVAFYGIAHRLGFVGLLIGTSVASVLFPRYAQLHALGDKEALDATFRTAQRYLVLIAAPVAAAMLALAPQGLNATVGPHYGGSVVPLRWLAAWALVMTLATAIQSRVLAEGRSRTLVTVAALGAGLDAVLNVLLVPPKLGGLGAPGAAATTFAAGLVCYTYLRIWSHRTHGTELWGVHLWRVLAAAGVAGLAWWSAGHWLPPAALDHAWELGVAGALGLLLYGGLLLAFGEVRRDELRSLAQALRQRASAGLRGPGPGRL